MVSNPISYTEIDAFNRCTAAGLTPWEIRLIRRVDDRMRSVAVGDADPTTVTGAKPNGLFSLLRAKAEASRKKKEAKHA